jgi:AcrR family transcriptional regulator
MSVPDKSIDPRLLASAEAEFLDKGFIKAELKTICENAGITTGAVYKRYKGKEDLFCAVVDDMKQAADEILKLRDMGKTVFIVTHDLEFILSCCDHIVRLEKGQVVENFELNKDTGIRLRQFFKNES